MRKLIVAALLAGVVATPAPAQDAAPFTGARVEAIVGGDRLKSEGDHEDGLAYGIGVGYDFQMGGMVLGVEGEASESSTKQCVDDIVEVGDELCLKAGRDLYAGARVGGVIGDSTLIYGKAGYTNVRAKLAYDAAPGSVLEDDSEGDNLDGVRFGGGVEQRIGTNAFLKAEYRYSNYEAGIERHQIVGGVGFRF